MHQLSKAELVDLVLHRHEDNCSDKELLLIRELHDRCIALRIACDGYPLAESRYNSVADYEATTGFDFI